MLHNVSIKRLVLNMKESRYLYEYLGLETDILLNKQNVFLI